MATSIEPLLAVRDLEVRFPAAGGIARAANGVSLEVRAGERVAVVGESGSGKSVTASAIVGLVPPPGRIAGGSVTFDGQELIGMDDAALSAVRGREIGFVLQDPMQALDPLKTIGSQVGEGLRVHGGASRAEARERALALLEEVRIGDPEQRIDQYGHEMSGGMSQRAMIAAAIAARPRLLIADEPTSALDATTADGVLDLIGGLARESRMAVLLITHDFGVVAKFADRVVVMYAGRVVEDGPAEEVLERSHNPYTRALLESVPGALGKRKVRAVPGSAPQLVALPDGCSFHPRCGLGAGRALCRTERPELRPVDGVSLTACHFAEELERPTAAASEAPDEPVGATPARAAIGEALLTVESLSRSFELNDGLFARGGVVRAVDGISFTVRRGETLALVGESGSGKSTTANMILGLEEPSGGRVLFDGHDLRGARTRRDRALRRRIQVVFQNPDASLDSRMRVADIVSQPLDVHRVGTPAERAERVGDLLRLVGLDREHAERYPHELSGGQRQRIAIARALALEPDLVICDEPVTALDVSVQAQILNLMQDVQARRGLAYLFIAHDLSVVRQIADRVAVMYLGEIVELADAEAFFERPRHPYSVALVSAMSTPGASAAAERRRVVLSGTVPSPFDPPPGCRFHTRCWKAQAVCRQVHPDLTAANGDGRAAACHFPEEG